MDENIFTQNKISFGQYLKMHRENKGYTQQKLAEIIKITQKSISYIERGENYPSPDNLFELAKVLDMSLDEFVFSYRKFDKTISFGAINEQLEKLSPDSLHYIYMGVSSCITLLRRETWIMDSPNMEDIMKDIDYMSVEDKISYLYDIIDKEKDKSTQQINYQLIESCTQQIRILMVDIAFDIPDEKIKAIRLQNGRKVLDHSIKSRNRIPKKIPAMAASILLVLCVSVIFSTQVKGFDTVSEYINYIAEFFNTGERNQKNGITFIHEKNRIVYNDIQSLIISEELNIYFPSLLPEGVYIEKILLTGDLNEKNNSKLMYVFSDSEISLSIQNYHSVNIENSSETFESPIGQFYIQEFENTYQAICHLGQFEYKLNSNDKTTLILILKGLNKYD